MAENPQQTMASRTDRAESEMFLRRMLLRFGYDNLPESAISKLLMGLGPAGELFSMAGMDFLARALTPKGTNIAPAGAAPDGTPWVEYFDVAMRNSKNQAAKGMAGETIAMVGGAALGVTGPLGLLLGTLGNFAARSGIRALTPPNWLRRMFVAPGTNLQPMKMDELSREMVTFARAKLSGREGIILSGADIERMASQPSENPNALTVKFDRIWKLEMKLKDPSRGPMHQLVKQLSEFTDKDANPVTVLSTERFANDKNHPFYIPEAGVMSKAWEKSADALMDLVGIPDKETANTAFVMATHRAAMSKVSDKEMQAATEAGKKIPESNGINHDWSRVPHSQFVIVGAHYNKKGVETEVFHSERDANDVTFVGRDGKRYNVQEFKELLDTRAPYVRSIDIKPFRSAVLGTDREDKNIKEAPDVVPERSKLGSAVTFAEASEDRPDAARGRVAAQEVSPAIIAQIDHIASQNQKLAAQPTFHS